MEPGSNELSASPVVFADQSCGIHSLSTHNISTTVDSLTFFNTERGDPLYVVKEPLHPRFYRSVMWDPFIIHT